MAEGGLADNPPVGRAGAPSQATASRVPRGAAHAIRRTVSVERGAGGGGACAYQVSSPGPVGSLEVASSRWVSSQGRGDPFRGFRGCTGSEGLRAKATNQRCHHWRTSPRGLADQLVSTLVLAAGKQAWDATGSSGRWGACKTPASADGDGGSLAVGACCSVCPLPARRWLVVSQRSVDASQTPYLFSVVSGPSKQNTTAKNQTAAARAPRISQKQYLGLFISKALEFSKPRPWIFQTRYTRI